MFNRPASKVVLAAEAQSVEKPRYRLLARAYFDGPVKARGIRGGGLVEFDTTVLPGVMLEKDDEVEYEGLPGGHMEPLNTAARNMVEAHPPFPYQPADEPLQSTSQADLAALSNARVQTFRKAKPGE